MMKIKAILYALAIAILLINGATVKKIDSVSIDDTTPPIVEIEYPEWNSIFNASHGASINVSGRAVDSDSGIVKMEWKVIAGNKERRYSDTLPIAYKQVNFELPLELFEGKNIVVVNMTDDAGNTGGDIVWVWYVCCNLTAIAHGPYYGKVGEDIEFNGSAYLGTPPYTWHWDFGDGNTSGKEDPKHAYTKAGSYMVELTVFDSLKNSSIDITEAIIYETLTAEANGPYGGVAGHAIKFYGSASGGIPPYNWHWDFGDGTTSNEQNPEHIYTNIGDYTVQLVVEDSIGNIANDSTSAHITEEDSQPPAVEITRPMKALYINDREVIPLPFSVIIGRITIIVEANDNSGIEKVEFYVDNEIKHINYTYPYYWIWDENVVGSHKIKVIAYDLFDNSNFDEMKAYVINIG